MNFRETGELLSYTKVVENSKEIQELIRKAIGEVYIIMNKSPWSGPTGKKVALATKQIKENYPTLCWRVIVTEGINQYLKN